MIHVPPELDQKWLDGKLHLNETTLKCSLCRTLFPGEYGACPSCNLLK